MREIVNHNGQVIAYACEQLHPSVTAQLRARGLVQESR